MKILVTGGTGFVGTRLCRTLCAAGHQVILFHRSTSFLDPILDLPLDRRIGDLTDENSLNAVMELRPEAVFHLGAQMTEGNGPSRLINVNAYGTENLLKAALKYGVGRVVMMSSALTMGIPEPLHGSEPLLISETHPFGGDNGQWTFARSKVRAEQMVREAVADGLDVVILNPFMIIGPGDHYRRNSSLLLQLRKRPPRYYTPGGLNLLPVDDAVLGLQNALRYGKKGERYLLCGKNISLTELIDRCAGIAGFEKPKLTVVNAGAASLLASLYGKLYPGETNLYRFANRYFYYDPAKSRLGLHLPPVRDIDQCIRDTYRWFEENK